MAQDEGKRKGNSERRGRNSEMSQRPPKLKWGDADQGQVKSGTQKNKREKKKGWKKGKDSG